MANKTGISWTDSTINFWTGCSKVSEGCKYCYMFRDGERKGLNPTNVIKTTKMFYKALDWKRPRKIFTCSWSDFFIKEADEWRDDAWKVIKEANWHTWQILTKRSERIIDCLPSDWGDGYDNVWLGVSVENNARKYRIDELRAIPAKLKWVSFEPLVGKITNLDLAEIDWVVIGGESGEETGKYRYREAKTEWFNDIIDACNKYDVKIFVKQMGSYISKKMEMSDSAGTSVNEFPAELRLRDFPT